MSQLYARVFLKILDSSIAEDWITRHVFEDLLKVADDGVVDMTRDALSRRLNIPLDILNASITKLESPDPKSRNPDHEGKRIALIDDHRDWGWIILNWSEYDKLRSKDDQAAQTRERVRIHRSKFSTPTSTPYSSSSPEGTLQNVTGRYTALRNAYIPTPQALMDYWNAKTTLAKVQTISTKGRARHLSARLSEPFFREHWKEAIDKLEASDFCHGKGSTGWKATIDFLLQPDTVAKAMEGKYENRKGNSGKPNPRNEGTCPTTTDYRAAAAARSGIPRETVGGQVAQAAHSAQPEAG